METMFDLDVQVAQTSQESVEVERLTGPWCLTEVCTDVC
ncbi:FDLD family class I lanthipeptide [Tumebacillus flagellatus]